MSANPFAPLFPPDAPEVRPMHIPGQTPKSKRLNKFVFHYDHKRKRGVKVVAVKAHSFREACSEFLAHHYPRLKHEFPCLGSYWIKFTNNDAWPVRRTNIRDWLHHYDNNTNPTGL